MVILSLSYLSLNAAVMHLSSGTNLNVLLEMYILFRLIKVLPIGLISGGHLILTVNPLSQTQSNCYHGVVGI
jgi:hypothetical protein